MKRYLWIVMALVAAAEPALAARTVYLKEGGTITATSVWRSKGQVHVLVNRDTLTQFPSSEIDLKRTFPRRHRSMTTSRPSAVHAPPTAATAAAVKTEEQKDGKRTSHMTLPEMPKIKERNPEDLVPSSGGGGSIRQHKKELAERIGD
ncbi:MAG TPA: hypothetical protein HPP94_07715 [Desulfuromonadales bacterium]|nr:hypothetical protein [Desulfuromonadales bacterium]